ncbi:MAG: glycosyltransferase family 4 protein [Candidatus Rhabdochlamydia sp.]|jgi:UDP-glucose:(heptosyl)LPS alpha-1,3-glucosyltransferase|nr:UDP-glucose:(heptosyl)LPS alpha,3-glucosyltransferase [Chlamydiota bacterium]
MKHRITLLKSSLTQTGGLEKYTWQIAQRFCQKKIPVTLLTTGNSHSPFESDYLNIVSFPIDYRLSVLNLLQFNRCCVQYIKTHPTPIIFGLDRNQFQTHIRAGNGVHAAYLNYRAQEEGVYKKLSFFFNPLHQMTLQLEKKAFEHPELQILFTNSHLVKQEVLSYYNLAPEKIQVVHNGVEWTALEPYFHSWHQKKQAILQNLKLPSSCYHFLFIGNNYRRKGLSKLLQALSLIGNQSFHLSVIGKEYYLADFEQQVSALNLESKVTFFGSRNDTYQFYQYADSLVIPSFYDPFANVTVEALAMGLFVVSSARNGGSEILSPTTGTVIESLEDISSFAEALHTALTHPKTEKSALAIRESVKSFDFSHQLDHMIESILINN